MKRFGLTKREGKKSSISPLVPLRKAPKKKTSFGTLSVGKNGQPKPFSSFFSKHCNQVRCALLRLRTPFVLEDYL